MDDKLRKSVIARGCQGKFPVMKKIVGPFYAVLQQLPDFVNDAIKQWEGK